MIECLERALDSEQNFQQLVPARKDAARGRSPHGGRVRLATAADRQQDAG